MHTPRAPRRPELPMTSPPHLEGALRMLRAVETIISEPMDVPLAAAVAAEAIARMDAELRPFATAGVRIPYVYHLLPEERRMVERLTQKHPPTPEILDRAAALVDRLGDTTTCDELALVAVKAAEFYSRYPDGWRMPIQSD